MSLLEQSIQDCETTLRDLSSDDKATRWQAIASAKALVRNPYIGFTVKQKLEAKLLELANTALQDLSSDDGEVKQQAIASARSLLQSSCVGHPTRQELEVKLLELELPAPAEPA